MKKQITIKDDHASSADVDSEIRNLLFHHLEIAVEMTLDSNACHFNYEGDLVNMEISHK